MDHFRALVSDRKKYMGSTYVAKHLWDCLKLDWNFMSYSNELYDGRMIGPLEWN